MSRPSPCTFLKNPQNGAGHALTLPAFDKRVSHREGKTTYTEEDLHYTLYTHVARARQAGVLIEDLRAGERARGWKRVLCCGGERRGLSFFGMGEER